MIETYYVGTYWGTRRESSEECARRGQAFFEAMGRCDPFFGRWFRAPPSRISPPPQALELDIPTFQALFVQGQNHNDEGRVIEDLGFRIVVDNGKWPGTRQREFSSVYIRCGAYAASSGPNSCVLNLPSAGASMDTIVRAPMLANILRAMVLAWDPGWGVATSDTHRMMSTERATVGTFVGWLMYFPRQLGTVPPLPPPVQVEPIEGRGTLVILTPERFTASNPEHVALAARTHETLSQAGLLQPLP
jgi:hypothetical protein